MRNSEQTQSNDRAESVPDREPDAKQELGSWPQRPTMPPVPVRQGTGVEAIGAVLERREPIGAETPKDDDEDRQVIAAYVGEVARQFGDRLPAAATANQALALYRRAQTNRAAFLGMLFQAQAVTRARCAARPVGHGPFQRGGPPRQPMGFFFAVLADLLGVQAADRRASGST